MRLGAIAGLMAVGMLRLPGAPPSEPDAVTIVDSGSTNRPGFRIVIDPAGVAEFTSTPRKSGAPLEQTKPIRRTLPRAAVKRLRSDLEAAMPFASLPVVHCMKSVSFGSALTVAAGREQTPDLKCGDGGNAAMRNLIRDANEIVALFPAN